MVSGKAGEPEISVGIMDRRSEVAGLLNGHFMIEGTGLLAGLFRAGSAEGTVALLDEGNREIVRSPFVRLIAHKGSTFGLFDVTIGVRFHWERNEDQTFQGNLVLRAREDNTIVAINEIPLEDYLVSVISSEMSAKAPKEFLKAHAIMSRSWILAALEQKNGYGGTMNANDKKKEYIHWYNREDHDLFDVCADDHCQRYQGITKIKSAKAEEAVNETRGMVISHEGKICDARYYKSCGGLTENYETAWEDRHVPYLVSIADSTNQFDPVGNEDDAARWILSTPDVYCNTQDKTLLSTILPDFDRETTSFFRWKVKYGREELEDILRDKSGIDFGTLKEIVPLERGPSGRICLLRITGSKNSAIVGKELEIRRWLSPSHLYSSAFVISAQFMPDGKIKEFTFNGAGWGHGVGLCQIGAAVMALKGFTAKLILRHYFSGIEIKRVY